MRIIQTPFRKILNILGFFVISLTVFLMSIIYFSYGYFFSIVSCFVLAFVVFSLKKNKKENTFLKNLSNAILVEFVTLYLIPYFHSSFSVVFIFIVLLFFAVYFVLIEFFEFFHFKLTPFSGWLSLKRDYYLQNYPDFPAFFLLSYLFFSVTFLSFLNGNIWYTGVFNIIFLICLLFRTIKN